METPQSIKHIAKPVSTRVDAHLIWTGEPFGYERHRERLAQDRVLSSRFDSRLQDHVSGFRVHLGRGRLGRSTGFLFRVARNRRRTSAEEAFRAHMSMREPAEYGNDEVPIPVFYVLEIYQDTFRRRHETEFKARWVPLLPRESAKKTFNVGDRSLPERHALFPRRIDA